MIDAGKRQCRQRCNPGFIQYRRCNLRQRFQILCHPGAVATLGEGWQAGGEKQGHSGTEDSHALIPFLGRIAAKKTQARLCSGLPAPHSGQKVNLAAISPCCALFAAVIFPKFDARALVAMLAFSRLFVPNKLSAWPTTSRLFPSREKIGRETRTSKSL